MRLVRRDPNRAYLADWLWVPKSFVDVGHLQKTLIVQSVSEQELRIVELYRETEHHVLVPREFWGHGALPYELVDCRPAEYPTITVKSRITLDWDQELKAQHPTKTVQREAVAALLESRGGVLQLACGKGKSVIAIELICRKLVPTIILVDNTFLLDQWRDELLRHTDLTREQIGLIQADVFDWEKPVVLGTYQTLTRWASTLPEEVRRRFGLIIWDEGHHLGAETFSSTAPLFYGYRLLLSATPERDDGMHVIYNFHVGGVIYKDLNPDLKTRIHFSWTGLKPNFDDPTVREKTHDCNGELHLKMLSAYLGQWAPHQDRVLEEVQSARERGRKVLVLSESIDELINLYARWKGYEQGKLFTDIPVPIPAEVEENVIPALLTTREQKMVHQRLAQLHAMLRDSSINFVKRQTIEKDKIPELLLVLKQHECARKLAKLLRSRQRAFLQRVLEDAGDAGLMIGDVDKKERQRMLAAFPVTFAIRKYGSEGMDSKTLDTVILTLPVASRNSLQQIMGRPGRPLPGKKQPLLIVLEHDIGPVIGICKKMRGHLRSWPIDEGGPYDYIEEGHPKLNLFRRANVEH